MAGRSDQRARFDMAVRMDLTEMDLDDIEKRHDEDHEWTKTQFAEMTSRITSLTRSNWALVMTVIGALIAVVGTLVATR